MKKHLLLFFLIITFSTQVFSQIETKTRILGGNASMIASNSGISFFNFNPGAGFFINDHICIGASASLLFFNEDFYWGAAPFGRYYFTPKKTQSVFASSSLGISNQVAFTLQKLLLKMAVSLQVNSLNIKAFIAFHSEQPFIKFEILLYLLFVWI